MTNYLIQAGNTLSGIAKQFGLTVKQLQDANNIKNANLIFAGQTLQIPDIQDDNAFKIQGLSIEHAPAAESEDDVQDVVQNTPTVAPSSVLEDDENTFAGVGPLSQTVTLGPGLTEEEVLRELQQMHTPGQRVKPLSGETNEHLDYWRSTIEHETNMVCRDASGRTQNISGRFNIVGSEDYEINPEAFTITDNSSGSDHKYLYRKAGITADGKLIYKCVSMNGDPITTDNQYTLEWKEDGTPELVQYDDQDNYGVGLKVGTKQASGPYQTAGQ